jgi:hypothetical protein
MTGLPRTQTAAATLFEAPMLTGGWIEEVELGGVDHQVDGVAVLHLGLGVDSGDEVRGVSE